MLTTQMVGGLPLSFTGRPPDRILLPLLGSPEAHSLVHRGHDWSRSHIDPWSSLVQLTRFHIRYRSLRRSSISCSKALRENIHPSSYSPSSIPSIRIILLLEKLTYPYPGMSQPRPNTVSCIRIPGSTKNLLEWTLISPQMRSRIPHTIISDITWRI